MRQQNSSTDEWLDLNEICSFWTGEEINKTIFYS